MSIDDRHTDRNRKFYDLPPKIDSDSGILKDIKHQEDKNEPEELFELILKSEIGNNEKFLSPFGYRRTVYCDYTASGRALSFIEDFIRNEVLTEYGNTHTTSTATSLQTTLFRNESRELIKNCLNASEHDCLIFVGSGCTGAIHKLINALNLTEPPVVFVSPYEHHSNLLPWREALAEMVYINESEDGSIDLQDLENKLKMYTINKSDTRVKIGTFSAASNITGIISDVVKITILLHKYGFLSFWDYASAGPHLDININPFVSNEENKELARKDAVFISTHKFIGGPQTPGILCAKKSLFKNRVPNGCGGGTVFFVTKKDHRYLKNDEMREEGGTPAIVESIRAGLVFQLKQAIGVDAILNREHYYTKKAIQFLFNIPNFTILGSVSVQRLSIFSFLIKHEQTGLYLHPNFITSLLNDLFGIQTRSGCACAGPYSQYLMGISYELAKAYEEVLIQDERIDRHHLRIGHDTTKAEILRPGFSRFNLAFFFEEKRVDFILDAIKFVCEHGWKFLPLYIFNLETGEYRHRNLQVFKDRKWISSINYKNNVFNYHRRALNLKDTNSDLNIPSSDQECLQAAYKALETTKSTLQISDQRLIFGEETSKLRWFLLASEAYGIIHNIKSLYNGEVYVTPFIPRKYSLDNKLLNQLYDLKLNENNENEKNTLDDTLSYSEYAESYYTNLELENSIKLIRKEMLDKTNGLNDEYKKKLEYQKALSRKIDLNESNDKIDHMDHLCNNSKQLLCEYNKTNEVKPNCYSNEWHNPPKSIFSPFLDAVRNFDMIKDGDKVLVCLSGGKDSMSLLHAIRQYKFVAKSKNINFDFAAVTVDPKTSAYNPSSLKKYLAELQVPYFYEEQTILETAENLPYECASICSFCSRMKRGRIYHCARKNGYNVLALGQHLDDFSESFMMSLFYNGKLWSMKACYKNEDGDLRIIRPFVYVREKELRCFAEENKLPIITENCPACFEAPKERQRMKQLLAQQELSFPSLFSSLLSALKPIISIDRCKISIGSLSDYCLKLIKQDKVLYEELLQENKENFDENGNENF